jgi:hypothetical protein
MIKLWACFKILDNGTQDEFQGVFSTEEKAKAACRDWRYGYGPVVLDEEIPDNPHQWPGFCYPIVRTTAQK